MSARFSRRLQWEAEENALSRALAARRAAGLPTTDLTESLPARCGFASLAALARGERLAALLAPPGALASEPAPLGIPAAREAVAGYLREERGLAVDPARILLTASSSESYALLFKLLCDPGDVALVPEPSYPLLGWLTALEGVRAAAYPLRWDGEWHVDLAAVEALLAGEPRARAVLVVSPGNPTGAFLKADERERLAALCARQGCALISDEVFADFAAGPDPRRVETACAFDDVLSFSLGGLSKTCGLPQLKLGWCVAAGPAGEVRAALARLELIADTFLSVAGPVQQALGALLETRRRFQPEVRARCARNRAALAAARGASASWDLLPAEGGWSAILRTSRARSDEEHALALLAQGVLVHPGWFFDLLPGHLVVSLLPEPAAFGVGACELAQALAAD